MSWLRLEQGNPEMAAFGARRLHDKVAYLATVRKDGGPRVHPVTPIIGQGHLFLFMEPTSPKGHDLRRDGRYALHCGMSDSSGESGEFWVMGTAQFVTDQVMRAIAERVSGYAPKPRYILFELEIERAAATVYQEGKPTYQNWRRAEEKKHALA